MSCSSGEESPRRLATQEITTATDSREILAHARRQAAERNLSDYFIVDVDSHHVESESWPQILDYVEDPVIRYNAQAMTAGTGARGYLHNSPGLLFQDVFGRIPHQQKLAEPINDTDDTSVHRDITLVRRAMESMGTDIQVVFPQPMLSMGLHPLLEAEVQLSFAYNRWFADNILAVENRIKGLLYLPFGDPGATLRMVREFAGKPGVVGFMVTSTRDQSVHDNAYLPVYAELEELGLPIAFHAGPNWNNSMSRMMNRFLSVHAISFVLYNMVHLTNWIVNGLPERFPRLKVIWIESGLAWVPMMMQRLDHEYLMRQSDAPLLRRLPSEYMRDMYYSSQPMESGHPALLEATFAAMNAESQLMWSSDWPHWDFDLPSTIYDLPFLTEQGRRNILGETARKVFQL